MRKKFEKLCALTVFFAFVLTFFPIGLLQQEAQAASIAVTTTSAKNITADNATVQGKVSYSGTRPSSVGIYFGTSASNLKKVASDRIKHNKNPFDMWYDMQEEAGITLNPGTMYYYQCYAIQDGKETRGSVVSFQTTGSSTSTNNNAVSNYVSVTTTNAKEITTDNATVQGKVSYRGTRPSSVGIYFGTSSSNMNKVARDNIDHNKNPFDMWYDMQEEAGITLNPDTTYYYQCYAIQDGKETKGSVVSFKTDKKADKIDKEETGVVGDASIAYLDHVYNDEGYCKDCSAEYPLVVEKFCGTATILKDNAAVHDRPYGAADIVDRQHTGGNAYVIVKGKTVNSFGNVWYKLNDSKWIVSDYVRVAKRSCSYGDDGFCKLCGAKNPFAASTTTPEVKGTVSNDTASVTGGIRAYVDNQAVVFHDQAPVIQEGRTLLPVRAVAEAMHKDVKYADGIVTITDNEKKMTLMMNKKIVTYTDHRGASTDVLDVAPTVYNGRTMLPIRVVAEYFGYTVSWDDTTQTLAMKKK